MTFHLLFDRQGPRIPPDGDPTGGVPFASLDPLVATLKAGQASLLATRLDDLIGLCDAAAAVWTRSEHPMAATIRQWDLGFLPLWMRRDNLRQAVHPFAARPARTASTPWSG